jgi:hypothetical protein
MASGEVVYFDHEGSDCQDRYHCRFTGRWRAELNLGKDGKDRRRRRKASASSKAELQTKLDELREEISQGVESSPGYTVAKAVEEWLVGPMADRAAKQQAESSFSDMLQWQRASPMLNMIVPCSGRMRDI